jgi:hypothetical protein
VPLYIKGFKIFVMEINLVKEKILHHKDIPGEIKTAILQNTSKVSAFSMPSERIISLYRIRLDINKDNQAYKKINLEMEKILNFLRNNDQKMVTIISAQSSMLNVGIFTDDNVDRILGILDFTGLGNRYYVLPSEEG